MKTKAILFAVATTLCLVGCSKGDDNDNINNKPAIPERIQEEDPVLYPSDPADTRHSYKPVQLDETQRAINQKLEAFSWKLFKEVYANCEEGENLMISPISLEVDLGMFLNGLEGETLQEVKKTMGLEDFTQAQINEFFHTMMTGIEKADEAAIFKGANAFWYNQTRTANADFLTAIQTSYDAKAEAVNFADPQTVKTINAWCAEQTNDRIKEMLQETSDKDLFHLMNAVYFKAGWEDPFEKDATKEMPFHYANGKTEMVDMMSQTYWTAYAETDKYQLCTRPFVDHSFQMVLILPKEGVAMEDAIPAALDFKVRATAEVYVGKPESREVVLYAPKFTAEYTAKHLFEYMKNINPDLVLVWQDVNIFSPKEETPKEEMLLDATQKTFFLMDEEGAEAAAVTDIFGEVTAVIEHNYVYMTLDRPFIYAIVETETGCPLFIGYYGN